MPRSLLLLREQRPRSGRPRIHIPALIVTGALAVSGLIFFAVTRPASQRAAAVPPPSTAPVPQIPPSPSQPTLAKPAALPPPQTAAPQPTPQLPPAPPPTPRQPPAFGFARPLDLAKELARNLIAEDFAKAGLLAAAADPAQASAATALFAKMVKDLGAKPLRDDQVELLGQVQNQTRLAIPLITPGSSTPMRLELDVERDQRMGWKVSRLHVPPQLAAAVPPPPPDKSAPAPVPNLPPTAIGNKAKSATTPPPKTAAPPLSPLITIAREPDALSFASDFVHALLAHDFAAAQRCVADGKVPAERLIGLCVVFEEGRYELKPGKPMVATVASPEVAWVIAQVHSPEMEQSTEFGIELQRAAPGAEWRVVGLNLSEILGSYAASASKMGVPYTPVVKNPKGGESLALYFEYDQARLHPRAKKQLDIVASLLKSDPARRLRITGHTDAKGAEDYNIGLSQSRAESVKQQLVALGVPPEQVETQGLGTAQPIGPNQKADGTDDPTGRSKNRRAEIYLNF